MRVYLNEYNIRMERSAYLPIATGLLRAYAETHESVRCNYTFAPFLYHVDSMANILPKYDDPAVAGFSVSMWNEQLNLTVAAEVKRRWPKCLIVFGGPQVPQHPQAYFAKHPFIDVAVRAEGEEAFTKILLRKVESRDFSGLTGVSWRAPSGECVRNEVESHQPKDLDIYPSPYLEGLYDEIMADSIKTGLQLQAIIETNRGCPFPCSFCYWGQGGLSRKYRFHGVERVRQELEWSARNKIRYVFNADCLAEGTLVDTPSGKQPIESLLPGDSVYGYNADSNQPALNIILASVFAGVKAVLGIGSENGEYVEASENHRFYTRSGWRKASELRVGDELLFRVREGKTSKKEVLFPSMLLHSRGTKEQTCGDTARGCGWELQGSSKNGSRETDCQRRGDASHSVAQEGPSRGEIQESTRCRFWRQELDASECQFSRTIGARREGEGYAQAFGLHMAGRKESSVPSDGARKEKAINSQLEKENAPVLGQPGLARQTFSKIARAAQWIREQGCRLYEGASTAVSFRWGSDLLAWAMPVWRLSEPGLYPGWEGKSEGRLGSRQVLASGREGCRSGARRLSSYGMGDDHHLGRYDTGQGFSEQNESVRWTRIEFIRPAGTKRTYDLVEAAPTHNFFAGGVLVSNSNFGMHKRDEEIAQILVEIKTEHGYPEKFRTCFGKNADERIYAIATKLHAADLEKGITLALQSNNKAVLKNIQRQNIKLETYKALQVKFNEAHVPVYSELILGLPGETFETWKAGVEEMLSAGLKNQLFIYLCQIFPNTEMDDPAYQKRFGIVTKRIELNEIHGAIRTDDLVTEYEDVIVTTDAMPLVMWREMVLFSWLTMVTHSLKIAFFIMLWLADRHKVPITDFVEHLMREGARTPIMARELGDFNAQLDRLLAGSGRGRRVEGYAPIYWDEEEASFLRIVEGVDAFYEELHDVVRGYLNDRGIAHDAEELSEVIAYQRLRIPTANDEPIRVRTFERNVPEYFDRLLTSSPVELRAACQTMTIYARQFPDRSRFAVETLMWGRKSGTIMTKVEWTECERIAA